VIAALRRRHARAIGALATAAPIVVLAALVARTPVPVAPDFPAPLANELRTPVPPAALTVAASDLLWRGLPILTRVLALGDTRYVELTVNEPLRAPDLLLYGSAAPAAGNQLPTDARLLGRFGGSRTQGFALGTSSPTSLWLFSLAHGEVIGRASLAGAAR
jgi:hypothetical protein